MDTPECDKFRAVVERHNTQDIGEFLVTSEYVLAQWIDCEDYHESGGHCMQGAHLIPVQKSVDTVLAEHFGIDLNKVEQERRAILKQIRSFN